MQKKSLYDKHLKTEYKKHAGVSCAKLKLSLVEFGVEFGVEVEACHY